MKNDDIIKPTEKEMQNKEKMTKPQRVRPKKARKPFHKQKRIGIDKEPGYYYRLVNDDGDRVSSFIDAGYEPVEARVRQGAKDAADASQMGKIAHQSVGNGMEAIYMRQKQEWFEEDQKEKQQILDARDKLIGMDKIDPSWRRGKVAIIYDGKKDN